MPQLLFVCTALFGAATSNSVETPRTLVMMGDQAYAPIEYIDDGGRPSGLLMEILRALEAQGDLRFDVRLVEWRDAQRRTLAGEADAIGFMSITEARLALFDFTAEVIPLTFSAFVRQGERKV